MYDKIDSKLKKKIKKELEEEKKIKIKSGILPEKKKKKVTVPCTS